MFSALSSGYTQAAYSASLAESHQSKPSAIYMQLIYDTWVGRQRELKIISALFPANR